LREQGAGAGVALFGASACPLFDYITKATIFCLNSFPRSLPIVLPAILLTMHPADRETKG
jgi:hypothetical protein